MIAWTRIRLTSWGRWARGGLPSMPSMSSTEMARMGRGGGGTLDMPPDIAEIDHIVCKAHPAHRLVLIVGYVHEGSWGDRAARLGLSRWQFRRQLESAEWYVHSVLDSPAQQVVKGAQTRLAASTVNGPSR